jgi:hypothetical protein
MIVSSFIIQANVITIVNYDRQTFIVQATGLIYAANIRLGWKGLTAVDILACYDSKLSTNVKCFIT